MAENFEYFHKEVQIVGKHSRYVDAMWTQGKVQESYFKKLVDLYIIAAVIGLKMKKTAPIDNTEEGKRTVPIGAMLGKIEDLNTIMQMVLLLDETSNLEIEQRVNRAFRGPENEDEFEQNVHLFNSYARGGIEILYNQLEERALGIEDEFTDRRVGNIAALFSNPLTPDIEDLI